MDNRRAAAEPAPVYDASAPAFAGDHTAAQKESQRRAGRNMLRDLAEAARRGAPSFTVTQGVYRIPSHALSLSGINGFTIEGSGAEWIVEPSPGRSGREVMSLMRCRNMRVCNLVLDADPPCAPVGQLVGWSAQPPELRVHMLAGYAAATVRPRGRILLFNREGDLLPIGMTERSGVAPTGEGELRLDLGHDHRLFTPPQDALLPLHRGLLVAFENDPGALLSFQFCEGLRLENITSYAGKFLLWERDQTGPNTYARLRTLRRPGTSRLIGGEGPQSSYLAGGPTLEDCEFTYTFDDGLNLNSTVAMVHTNLSPRVLVLQPRWKTFSRGTELTFYDFDSLDLRGAARVVACEPVVDPIFLSAARDMERQKPIGEFARGGAEVSAWRVEVDRDVTPPRFALAASSDHQITSFAIRRCRFRGIQTRAILINGPSNGVIEENTVEQTGMAGIAVQFDRWFLEGPFPRDVIVRRNRLRRNAFMTQIASPDRGDCGALYVGADLGGQRTTARVLERITVEGNRVEDSAYAGILLANVRGLNVRGNTIVNPVCRRPPEFPGRRPGENSYGEFPGAGLFLFACEDVEISDNRFEGLGPDGPPAMRAVPGADVPPPGKTRDP